MAVARTHFDPSGTHEEALGALRVVKATMPDRHGRAADGELPDIKVPTTAEAKFRSFIYDLGAKRLQIPRD